MVDFPISSLCFLKGQTLSSVNITGDGNGISFATVDGREYILEHDQECCETVTLEDVCGDLGDLVGSPILIAEHRTGEAPLSDDPDSDIHGSHDCAEYNFYEIATNKGSVTIRFHGQSNGYYSMGASLKAKGEGGGTYTTVVHKDLFRVDRFLISRHENGTFEMYDYKSQNRLACRTPENIEKFLSAMKESASFEDFGKYIKEVFDRTYSN